LAYTLRGYSVKGYGLKNSNICFEREFCSAAAPQKPLKHALDVKTFEGASNCPMDWHSRKVLVTRFVDTRAHLKTDELHSYKVIGQNYASHQWVNHLSKESALGDTHNNTAGQIKCVPLPE
jgi:hypothetical protein